MQNKFCYDITIMLAEEKEGGKHYEKKKKINEKNEKASKAE